MPAKSSDDSASNKTTTQQTVTEAVGRSSRTKQQDQAIGRQNLVPRANLPPKESRVVQSVPEKRSKLLMRWSLLRKSRSSCMPWPRKGLSIGRINWVNQQVGLLKHFFSTLNFVSLTGRSHLDFSISCRPFSMFRK